MNSVRLLFSVAAVLWVSSSILKGAETLLHYRVNSGDSTTSIPSLGTLGNGLPGGGGISYSFDTPFFGVPNDAGNNSIVLNGAGGILAPGTQQLLNSEILANGGFTYEAWFKWDGTGDFNAIIDYAGTEKLFRDLNGGLLMQTNNSTNNSLGAVPADQWRHVAVVFSNVTAAAGTHITGDYTFYLNGGPVLSANGVTINDFGDSLNRTIGVGTHPITGFTNNFFNGLIYEPRVTLGALTAGQLLFDPTVTTLTDEDDGLMGGGEGISLREAIKYGPPGSVITFSSFLGGGTVFLDETLGEIVIPHDLSIDASALDFPIAISGQGNSRIFKILGNQVVTMNHLVLLNGDSGAENGGGIFLQGATLTMTDCTIRQCKAECGGAITNDSSLTLIRCTLSKNTAATGGAICSGGSVTMEQCTFAENTATNSAGAIANWGSLSFNHCTVSQNSAVSFAGGIGKFAGTLSCGHTIIAGNFAPSSPDLSGTLDSSNGANIIGGDPILSALGDFGGKTETMLPLYGSPAIDSPQASGFTTDQRGFPRDSSPDIGATERAPVIDVTNANDSGPNSLRAAVNATGPNGATIVISPSLAGQTITLTSGQILISGKKGLIIDGSRTAPGTPLTISGNNASRIFSLTFGTSAILRDLTISDGFSAQGAGIYNGGQLELIDCTIKDNLTPDGDFFQGGNGGGIYNDVGQNLLLTRCTVSGNATGEGIPGEGSDNGGHGAGIFNRGGLLLDRCTFNGNACASGGFGGAIFSTEAFVRSTSSTLTGNSSSQGGAIWSENSVVLVEHSIVSFNLAPVSSNIAGSFDQNGTNNITDDDPVLAPLGNYGGRTSTMPPIAGSPAIDQAVGARHLFDQRGEMVVGIPDLGASELLEPDNTTLTWSNPGNIIYGTPLSATQLNATADHPGTISYATPLGTVLDAGSQTLMATFTPADPNRHTTANMAVTLIVEKANLIISADDQQREEGQANSPLTFSYDGLVNGDTEIAVPPTISTNADSASPPGVYDITLSGGSDPNYTLSFVFGKLTVSSQPISVSGTVWEDTDEDGIRSPDDPGIEGVQILIFDASGANLITITTTAADGSYSLVESDGLLPGAHTIALTLPIDQISRETLWVSTLRDQGSDEALDSDLLPCDLVAGLCLTQPADLPDGAFQWDAGLVRQGLNRGTVEGTLWIDEDQNSVFGNERGFGNGTVHLLTAAGDRLRTTQTDRNGSFFFLNVIPGSYRMRFEKPAGLDYFSPKIRESEVDPATGTSDVFTLGLGDRVFLSAGISSEPPSSALSQEVGMLRLPAETAQGVRLHRDSMTDKMSLRFTVLPLLRTAEGTDYYPAQHIEMSTDFQNWQPTGITIPASSDSSPRAEEIALEFTNPSAFFRVRVDPSQN